jgi:SWIM zinc finger
MSSPWTTEKVLALSPDASSSKSGQQLANANKWGVLGHSAIALWGECQGSGKLPYRTQIDLTEPAFRCSCPSRKFPCKHGLGLFLIFAGQSEAVTEGDPPDWVQEWLDKRSQTSQKKQEAKAEKPVDPVAQAKRVAQREAKVTAGLGDLDLFLRDVVRQGLATVQTQPYSYWDRAAARLVDAQAPVLAKRIRAMASIPHSGQGWADRLLKELGKLHLLVQGYQRKDTLPEMVQAELRSQIGWTLKQDELLGLAEQSDPTVAVGEDCWQVLGRRVTEEEDLQVQRVWLVGKASRRSALLLNFAHRSQALECVVMPGTQWNGTLIFYPGLYPLRAALKHREGSSAWTEPTAGYASVEEAIAHYGKAMAQNPWLENFPMLLMGVVPYWEGEVFYLTDGAGARMLLDPGFKQEWTLMALSGGHPVQIFGEWNGSTLMPLSLGVQGRWIPLEVSP